MLTPEALPVLADITLERDRQLDELGWTPDHDDRAGVEHLELLAVEWSIHASHTSGAEKRDALVKVAALLVAAIEVLDRASCPHTVLERDIDSRAWHCCACLAAVDVE